MYHNTTKEKFIKDYMKSRIIAETSLRSLFKKIQKYEEEINKDCCQFTINEVINMYKDFKAKSVYVLLNYNATLKSYCAWINYHNILTVVPSYDHINKRMLEGLVDKRSNVILSRDDISDIENQLLNWTDKAIVECLFEGISGDSMRDLVSINADMIDDRQMQIVFDDGRTYVLTDRLYNLLLKAFYETEYMCYGKTLRVKKVTGYGQLYKERDNAHASVSNDKYFRWVYRKIQNFRDYVSMPNLTMKNITTSGMCHYLKQGMQKHNCDLKTFLLSESGSELMDKYGYNSEFRVNNVILYYKDLV